MERKIIVYIVAIVCVVFAFYFMHTKLQKLQEDNDRLLTNQEILMTKNDFLLSESRKYKLSDSLNAIQVNELKLTLDEYKKFKKKDLETIKKLKIDKNELQKVIDTQAETINKISTALCDTVIMYRDSMVLVKAFSYKSKWTDVNGIIKKDSVQLKIKNREELTVVETVERKRFLGFLWKTNKIKSKKVDVFSKNPNTTITEVSNISIEK